MEKNKTRIEIIDAAMELFANKGYHETTMSDVVEASNTSKGTVYYYFDNKQELFETMINDVISRLYNSFERIAEKDCSVKEKLKKMMEVHANFYKKNYKLAFSIFMEGKKIDADCKEEIWRWHKKFNSLVENVMKDGVEEGLLKDKNLKLMSFSFLGLTNSFGPSVFEGDYDVNELVDYTIELFLQGVGRGNEG
ncbi:TetR/AcrR family transcriptional regulator [Halanaerobiaceae bacterium Z-7014]|uniref:TetR/AcrR family transcriptional regulator n=1 Tax=Halonatronomonas betaini TaxID=2778430 RepID=A0A931ASX2_9FIRM|nr:TetR/AcrR family transcriptional regulator [Halonatronomonas betaini]MBF8437301.1 TetR/AcrR family transcriptional regulator [Halonatronomonas betaini]